MVKKLFVGTAIFAVTVALGLTSIATAKTVQNVLTVTSPNGGESWAKGSQQTVSWTFSGFPANTGKTRLFLRYTSKGGAATNYLIAKGFPNTGSYTFTVPSNLPEGNYKAYVRVIEIKGSVPNIAEDLSDATFTVTAAGGTPPSAKCSDGIDNDGDGKTDYPADPGCSSAGDDSETDPVVTPQPQCADGVDNDGDGKTDYPADLGCGSTADNNEADVVAPPTPAPNPKLINEVFTPGFVNLISVAHNCNIVRGGETLTGNPLGPNGTTHAERRFLVQMRMFECMPPALQKVQSVLAATSDGTDKDEAMKLYFDGLDRWKLGTVRYTTGILRSLFAPKNQNRSFGQHSDAAYPWIYPGNAIKRFDWALAEIKALSPDTLGQANYDFLTQVPKPRKSNGITDEGFFRTGQVFFDKPLSAEQIAILDQLDEIHDEGSKAMICKKQPDASCAGAKPSAQVGAEFDALRMKAHLEYGLPPLGPFARGFDENMSYEQVCVQAQRVMHAHKLWTEGVKDGHTPEGFKKAWLGQLAHSIIHAETRLGNTDLTDVRIDKAEQFDPRLRAEFHYPVPGVVNGICDLSSIK